MGLLYASYVWGEGFKMCVGEGFKICVWGEGFKICVWGGGGVWNGPIVCKLCVCGRGLRYVCVGEGFKICVCVGRGLRYVCVGGV